MSANTRCCAQIFGDWHYHQCARPGVVKREGKLYCKTHDPEAVQKRRAARDAKWEAEKDRNKKIEKEAARLAKLLGVVASAQYDHFAKNNAESLVISFAEVEKLIRRMQ